MQDPTLAPHSAVARPASLATLFLASCLVLLAQTTTPSPALEPAKEEIIELSPFVVSSDSNVGYVATSSLGGGRIKTDYKDIANQVSVMTPEFLSDINAFDLNEAYNYSTNIETGTELTGLSSNFFGGAGLGLSAANRSRGLGGSTTTRNFFATNIPTNLYNTGDGGFTLASGPNAILFGLGNAGGISDSRLNSANLTKTKGQVKINIDSFGTRRGSLDYNTPLIPDKLALRVDALNSSKKTFLKPSYETDRRLFGTLKFQPVKKITMELSAETMYRDRSSPVSLLPKDQVTAWLNPGMGNSQPFNTPDVSPLGVATLATTPGSNGYLTNWTANTEDSRAPAYTFGSGITTPDIYFYRYVGDVRTIGNVLQNGYGATGGPITIPVGIGDTTVPANLGIYPFDELTPYGDTHTAEGKGKSLMSVNNIKITQDLYAEVAAYWETYKDREINLFRNVEAALHIDPNAYRYNAGYIPLNPTATGTTGTTNRTTNAANRASENPTYGKLYLEGFPQLKLNEKSYKEIRASLAYEFRPEKYLSATLAKFINSQRLFTNLSWNDSVSRNQEQRRRIQDNGVDATGKGIAPAVITAAGAKDPGATFTGTPNYMLNANRNFWLRMYIDPNDLNNQYGSFGGLDRYEPWTFNDGKGGTFNVAYVPEFAATLRRTQDLSKAFSWQGYFLKDKVVLTYAKRWDTLKTKANTVDVANPRTGLFTPWQDATWQRFETPPTFVNDTKSIVVHPFSWISAHYNESTNNAAAAPSNHDITGLFYPVATGNGKDYGVRLDYKGLSLRINKFETAATSTDAGNLGIRDAVANLEARYINLMRNRANALGLPAFNDYYLKSDVYPGYNPADNTREYYRIFNDTVSKGTEFELTGRIGKWNIRATYSTMDTVRDNVGPNFVAYALDPVIAQRMSNVEYYIQDTATGAYRPVVGFTGDTPIFGNVGDTPIKGWQNVRFADGNSKTIFAQWADTTLVEAANAQYLNGLVAPKLRGKRANLTAKYQINKAWSVGTSVRYRQEAIVGYYERSFGLTDSSGAPVIDTSTGVQRTVFANDVTRPIYNDAQYYFDPIITYTRKLKSGQKLTLQVNIINVLGKDDAYVLNQLASDRTRIDVTDPRFSYYGWADQSNIPISYQVQEPRSYSFTATLDF